MADHDSDNGTSAPLGPISPLRMQGVCRAISNLLPDHCGFMVVVVPLGDGKTVPPGGTPVQYAASVNRQDAVASLKALLFRWGIEEKWMEGAK